MEKTVFVNLVLQEPYLQIDILFPPHFFCYFADAATSRSRKADCKTWEQSIWSSSAFSFKYHGIVSVFCTGRLSICARTSIIFASSKQRVSPSFSERLSIGVGAGMEVPSCSIPQRCKASPSFAIRSASSKVSPVAMQPGKSWKKRRNYLSL